MFPSSDPAIHMPENEDYDPASTEGQYLQNASTVYTPNQDQSGTTSEQIANVFEPPTWSTEGIAAQDNLDFAPSDWSQDGTDGWNAGVGQSRLNEYRSHYAPYQQAPAPAQYPDLGDGEGSDPRYPYQPVLHEQPHVPLSQPGDAAGYHGASDIQARPLAPEVTFSDEVDYSDDNSLFEDDTENVVVPECGGSNPSILIQALLANSLMSNNDNANKDVDVDDVDAAFVGSAEFSDIETAGVTDPLRPGQEDSRHTNESRHKSISTVPQSGLQEAKSIRKYRNNQFWESVPAVSAGLLKDQKWQAWSSIDKGIRDPSDGEYKEWVRDECQHPGQTETDDASTPTFEPKSTGQEPYVEDLTDEDETDLNDEISSIEIPGLGSLHHEKPSSFNQEESLGEGSTRKDQPLPTSKSEPIEDSSKTSSCSCKSGATCSCISGQCLCKSVDNTVSYTAGCCGSVCKCGTNCACAPDQCSCQKSETTKHTLDEDAFRPPSQPHSPVRGSSPLKSFYTPREQTKIIDSDDSSPIPSKPHMTPIDRPDTPRPVDSSPGMSPIRQSVEPEFPRHMIRESTPAYVDRSPSPSPVSQRGDVEMGNASPPVPYHRPEPPIGADPSMKSELWNFANTFRLHQVVRLNHDTIKYRQTIEQYEELLVERTQRWNSGNNYDEDVRHHRLPTNAAAQGPTYPVQVEVDQSYPTSPANPYQTHDQTLSAQTLHHHTLVSAAASTNASGHEAMRHHAYIIPQSAPIMPSPASGFVYQGPSSAPPAILTTWPGQTPIPLHTNPLYYFLTTTAPGSHVSATWHFLPRNPTQSWKCIEQHGAGHEALIQQLCQAKRVISAPSDSLPLQPQPWQPTHPHSRRTTLPPPPPIPTSPNPTSPSTLRPSKTRATPAKKDNNNSNRRKSLGVTGAKIEKQKAQSVKSNKRGRKATTTTGSKTTIGGETTGKSKVGDAIKRIEAAEMKGNRVVTQGSRRSVRIREMVERGGSSSPAPER